ncbi:MAG: hypothetical protein KC464_07945, partial [Myxococcales bacterium]|nr:hypothetical protein [Myxococcales bacterium]
TATDIAERWLGTWTGKATWKGCTAEVHDDVALAIAPGAAGALTVDGDVLMDGLGAIDLAAGLDALSAPRADLSLTLTWTKRGAKLAVKTESGCAGKATLQRVGTGDAGCDALVALATLKSSCSQFTTEAGPWQPGELTDGWDGWKQLKGKARKARVATCKTEVATLRDELGQAQCNLGSGALTVFTTGLPDCDRYLQVIERYLQCPKVPQAARDAARQGIDAMKQGWADMSGVPDEARRAANDACRQAVDAVRQGASAMGCSL